LTTPKPADDFSFLEEFQQPRSQSWLINQTKRKKKKSKRNHAQPPSRVKNPAAVADEQR
jgi:hypothetical protein